MADRVISSRDLFPEQFLKELTVASGFSYAEINCVAEEITKHIDEFGPLSLEDICSLECEPADVRGQILANERSFGFSVRRAQEMLCDSVRRNHGLGIGLGEPVRRIEYSLYSFSNPGRIPDTNPIIARAAKTPDIIDYVRRELIGSRSIEADSNSAHGIVDYDAACFYSPAKSGWLNVLEMSWLANYRLILCSSCSDVLDYGRLKNEFCGFLRHTLRMNEKTGLHKFGLIYLPMVKLNGALFVKDPPQEQAPFWALQEKLYDSFWRDRRPLPLKEICTIVEKF